MIEIVRRTSRNVKRWQSGDMCLRWTAAGMLEAEQQFRKIIGYTDLAKLAVAVERDLATPRAAARHHNATARPLRSRPPDHHPGPPPRSSTTNGTTSRIVRSTIRHYRHGASRPARIRRGTRRCVRAKRGSTGAECPEPSRQRRGRLHPDAPDQARFPTVAEWDRSLGLRVSDTCVIAWLLHLDPPHVPGHAPRGASARISVPLHVMWKSALGPRLLDEIWTRHRGDR